MKCTSIFATPSEVYRAYEDARVLGYKPLCNHYIALIARMNNGEKILRLDIKPIVWLDNPLKYSYLRRCGDTTSTSKFPIKLMLRYHERDGGKLVGYCLIGKNGCREYLWVIYYLRSYDRDLLPQGYVGGYSGEHTFGGNMPCEAADPKTLLVASDGGRTYGR
jgi:hypothetical protein